MAWTEEQLLAMDVRDCDILVAAAAGSGKTAVLVERIFKLVCEGADIERMLIVTFTNAVASEMRERLAARFDAIEDDDRMRAQAQACRRAHIQTLHSFCRDVCRAYFQAADVDPGFRIIDQQEAQLIAQHAIEDTLLSEYENMDDDLAALNALRGPDEVRDMVLMLYTFADSRADADEWMNAQLSTDMRRLQREIVQNAIKERMQRVNAMLNAALRIAREDPDACIYEQALERDIAVWPTGDDLNALIVFEALRFSAAKGAPRGASNTPMCELIKQIRKRAKDMTAAVGKLASLLISDDEAERNYLNQALRALIRLVHTFKREYTRRKREKSALDFGDLEHCALRALKNSSVSESVRAMFDYVFVDEYQDISHVQESILCKISSPHARFMVGDVKQSIYRFRQADPSIFISKYDEFGTEVGSPALRIDLNRNFRSRANVLNFVNGIFSRIMNREQYEIEYDDAAALKPGLPVQPDDPAVEIHLLGDDEQEEETSDTAEDSDLEELSREESEAHVVARIIKELLGTQMLDQKAGKIRSVQARDIAVLARSVQSLAPKVLDVLLGEGIPAYADAGGGYFDTYEVRQLLELMRIIDNRLRDYDLLGVLHSPMFDFTAEDLGEIRAHTPAGSFSDALELYASDDESESARVPELVKRVREFIGLIDEWQNDALAMPLSDLMWMLLDETGYYVYVGALPGGTERQANLRLLCTRAASYEDSQYGGLHGFLQYVEQLKRAGQDMTTAATLGEGDDVVRIMSVHKSKGLEFPIVIGLNLGTSFRRADSGDLLLNGYAGMGMFRMDEENSTRYNTIARQAVALRCESEQLSEEMRILYVLLTRARDRLILVGSSRKLRVNNMIWRSNAYALPGSMLDWIMPAAYAMMSTGEANIQYYNHSVSKQSKIQADATLGACLQKLRDTTVDQAIYNRLTWRYPYQQAVLAPLKLTASNLGREIDGPAILPECNERPQFLSEREMNAMEKGIATHTVMQWINLASLRNLRGASLKNEIKSQLDELETRGALTKAQRAGVHENMILRYFESDIGQRMLASSRVEREWPFNLKMNADRVLSGSELSSNCANERILVQGVIDCCFVEDNQWILVDYKTDREEDIELLRERYISQLSLYARALRKITHMNVKQKGLFLLRRGEFLDLTEFE